MEIILRVFFSFCFQYGFVIANEGKGKRIEGHTYETLNTIGHRMCQNECYFRGTCKSVNYNREKATCELNTVSSGTLTIDTKWEYSSQTEFPIIPGGTCKASTCPVGTKCFNLNQNRFKCITSECNTPPSVDNAALETANRRVSDVNRYKCIENFEMIGVGTITCKAKGQYTPTNFHCKLIVCNSPPTVPHSTIETTKLTPGGIAEYTCKTGYRPKGTNKITCQKNKQWTSLNFHCEQILCPNPPGLRNGYVDYISGKTVGSYADYDCNIFFGMDNNHDRITCQPDGTWSPIYFECKFFGG